MLSVRRVVKVNLKQTRFSGVPVVLLLLWMLACEKAVAPQLPDPIEYACEWNGVDSLNWLDSVACPEEFEGLASSPIVPTLSGVRTVKVVYEIATGNVYFAAGSAYRLHFDFCREALGYTGSHQMFNTDQYGDGPERLYYLASINSYGGGGIYAMEFFADDRISAEGIRTLFTAAAGHTFFGKNLRLLANSNAIMAQAQKVPDVPLVTEDEIYGQQQFQTLNNAEAYGYLRKVTMDTLDETWLGRHDILVVNGIPIALPVIAGIITTEFQTPLSHVNVLSHNRGTPNLVLKTAWEDPHIDSLLNKLVYYKVSADTFELRPAKLSEAREFWDKHEPTAVIVLECHDDTAGLFPMSELSHESLHLVGAKAANLAELAKISVEGELLPIPEGAFAIPFFYYRRHLAKNGIDQLLEEMLGDSLFLQDGRYRATKLEALRDAILKAPLDENFVDDVESTIRSLSGFTTIRFRSSTNVEDIEGSNGAGLYESHSADLGKAGKSIAEAIRKVYASLWTLRGFEEREYFKIDQRSCAMGILVHRSFSDEAANGVAITANIYQPYVPAYTVNVQIKDISVVMPPDGFLSDQLLIHVYREGWAENPTIEYISHSNVNFGDPVLSSAEIVRLVKCLYGIKEYFYLIGLFSAVDYYRFAMDVEFKFVGKDRELYIKQARPYSITGEF